MSNFKDILTEEVLTNCKFKIVEKVLESLKPFYRLLCDWNSLKSGDNEIYDYFKECFDLMMVENLTIDSMLELELPACVKEEIVRDFIKNLINQTLKG